MLVLVAVLVAVSACAGGGDDGSGRSNGVATTTVRGGEEVGSDVAASELFSDEELAIVDELATIAVDELGSPEAAFDAVLLALDAGYDGEQIEAAIRAGTLRSGGIIDGVEPAVPPVNLVLGFRRSSPEPVPVERLREAATEEAAVFGLAEPGGRSALLLILVLLAKGLPPQAAIEALIIGFVWDELIEVREGCWVEGISVGGTFYPSRECPGSSGSRVDRRGRR